MKQYGFFDENGRLKKLSKPGDPFNACIDREQSQEMPIGALHKEPKGPGGRPPFDYVMMFKIPIPTAV
jgi:hypothetical protein